MELCAGTAVLPGTLRARGDTTTPPGTLSELCDTSWIFVRFSQYNQPTASLPNGRSGFGTPCGRTPHGSLRSRFFVSPLIGGAQQRGLRPRQVLRTLGGPTVLYPRFEPCQIHAKVSLTKLKTRMGSQVPPQSGGWQKGKNVQLYPSHLTALRDLLNRAHLPRQPGRGLPRARAMG